MSSSLEFAMKGMIVPPLLKYLSSNPVTRLQKNVNIFKRLLISFVLIFIKIRRARGKKRHCVL